MPEVRQSAHNYLCSLTTIQMPALHKPAAPGTSPADDTVTRSDLSSSAEVEQARAALPRERVVVKDASTLAHAFELMAEGKPVRIAFEPNLPADLKAVKEIFKTNNGADLNTLAGLIAAKLPGFDFEMLDGASTKVKIRTPIRYDALGEQEVSEKLGQMKAAHDEIRRLGGSPPGVLIEHAHPAHFWRQLEALDPKLEITVKGEEVAESRRAAREEPPQVVAEPPPVVEEPQPVVVPPQAVGDPPQVVAQPPPIEPAPLGMGERLMLAHAHEELLEEIRAVKMRMDRGRGDRQENLEAIGLFEERLEEIEKKLGGRKDLGPDSELARAIAGMQPGQVLAITPTGELALPEVEHRHALLIRELNGSLQVREIDGTARTVHHGNSPPELQFRPSPGDDLYLGPICRIRLPEFTEKAAAKPPELKISMDFMASLTLLRSKPGDVVVAGYGGFEAGTHRIAYTGDEKTVSTLHASFEPAGDGSFLVRDLNSKNGTRLNGEPIPPAGTVARPGDRVALANSHVIDIPLQVPAEPEFLGTVLDRHPALKERLEARFGAELYYNCALIKLHADPGVAVTGAHIELLLERLGEVKDPLMRRLLTRDATLEFADTSVGGEEGRFTLGANKVGERHVTIFLHQSDPNYHDRAIKSSNTVVHELMHKLTVADGAILPEGAVQEIVALHKECLSKYIENSKGVKLTDEEMATFAMAYVTGAKEPLPDDYVELASKLKLSPKELRDLSYRTQVAEFLAEAGQHFIRGGKPGDDYTENFKVQLEPEFRPLLDRYHDILQDPAIHELGRFKLEVVESTLRMTEIVGDLPMDDADALLEGLKKLEPDQLLKRFPPDARKQLEQEIESAPDPQAIKEKLVGFLLNDLEIIESRLEKVLRERPAAYESAMRQMGVPQEAIDQSIAESKQTATP